jgi:hypothetical protein
MVRHRGQARRLDYLILKEDEILRNSGLIAENRRAMAKDIIYREDARSAILRRERLADAVR